MENGKQAPGVLQTAWQLKVLRLPDNEEVWNTGRVEGDQSNEIFYDGAPLLACTRYDVFLTVWDELHQECQGKTWFETGLMDPSIRAWEGADFYWAFKIFYVCVASWDFCAGNKAAL